MREIRYICKQYNTDETYTLDEKNMLISDKYGNTIKINPTKIYETNLPLLIHLMFKDLYTAIKSFDEDISNEELNHYKCEEF